jgi:hypothetical protein
MTSENFSFDRQESGFRKVRRSAPNTAPTCPNCENP